MIIILVEASRRWTFSDISEKDAMKEELLLITTIVVHHDIIRNCWKIALLIIMRNLVAFL